MSPPALSALLLLLGSFSETDVDPAGIVRLGKKLSQEAVQANQAGRLEAAHRKIGEALKALDAFPKVVDDDPAVTIAFEDLLWLYYDLARASRGSGARELEGQALQSLVDRVPSSHRLWMQGHFLFADSLQALRDLEGAAVVWRKTFEVLRASSKKNDEPLLRAEQNLAGTLFELGNYQESMQIYQEVLESSLGVFPEDDDRVQMARGNLAMMQAVTGDLEVALLLQKRVVASFARKPPQDANDLHAAHRNLERTELRLKRRQATREPLVPPQYWEGRLDAAEAGALPEAHSTPDGLALARRQVASIALFYGDQNLAERTAIQLELSQG
jgi:tetratricopeptide (TPR) repeat protein